MRSFVSASWRTDTGAVTGDDRVARSSPTPPPVWCCAADILSGLTPPLKWVAAGPRRRRPTPARHPVAEQGARD